jgi:hypothetical protein
MRKLLIILLFVILEVSVLRAIALMMPQPSGIMSELQAIRAGREFLDGMNAKLITGKVLFAKLEETTPNFYWHDVYDLEKPIRQESELCWVVRFEQASRPGHLVEVWMNAHTGEVIGGRQCK